MSVYSGNKGGKNSYNVVNLVVSQQSIFVYMLALDCRVGLGSES